MQGDCSHRARGSGDDGVVLRSPAVLPGVFYRQAAGNGHGQHPDALQHRRHVYVAAQHQRLLVPGLCRNVEQHQEGGITDVRLRHRHVRKTEDGGVLIVLDVTAGGVTYRLGSQEVVRLATVEVGKLDKIFAGERPVVADRLHQCKICKAGGIGVADEIVRNAVGEASGGDFGGLPEIRETLGAEGVAAKQAGRREPRQNYCPQ